jgi:hypothetical protein
VPRSRHKRTGHFRVFWEALRYNLPDCPVCTGQCPVSQRSNSHLRATADCKTKQCAVRSDSRKWERIGHVWCATGLSGAATRQGLQRSTAPNPNGQLTWHAPNTEQGHVRCTTGLSGAPLTTTTRIMVGAINTSQPPPFKSSKFSELHIQYKSKRLHSKTQSIEQILSKPPNQLNCLVTWERGCFVFFCCSCCLDCFLLLILVSLSAL